MSMPGQVSTDQLTRLRNVFADMRSVLVAYSGGIDSTLVLKMAQAVLGDRALGVTAVSPTLPGEELETAIQVAREIGVRHEIVRTDQLLIPDFVKNDASRCFHCKSDLYQLLDRLRTERNVEWVADGTNLDDMGDDRPGITAARAYHVRSPLLEASCTKADVRTMAERLGISTWAKPAAACLSSRIPRGTPITIEKLRRVELAESFLHGEGLRHIRVRDHGDIARIEAPPEDFEKLAAAANRERISRQLREFGFRFVCVDLEGYRPGGISLG